MAAPFESDPGGQRAEVPVVRVAPVLPWQEAAPLSYRVVELPVENDVRGSRALPDVNWIYRPPLARADALAPEADDVPYYDVVAPCADVEAELRRRHRADVHALELLILSKKRLYRPRRRRRETHWYQCLAFPFLGWRLLLGLAATLGLATTWLVFLLPALQPFEIQEVVTSLPFVLIPLVLLAYGCGFLQCVLNGAVAGDAPYVCWPGYHVNVALGYAGRWLVCFLAGPALLAGGALVYWIHCGELEFLDWLILAELGILAVGYWLFALLAVTRSNRLRDANPLRIAELAHRLRYRAAVAIGVAALLAYQHGRWMLGAVEELHDAAFGGWLLVTLCWLSGLACAAFLLRLVGLWCYRHVGECPATAA